MLYKCIFVDWYQTLSVSLFWEQLKDANHPLNAAYPSLSTLLFAESPDLLVEWMRGNLTSEDVVQHLCGKLDLDPEIILQELILSCQRMKLMSDNTLNLVAALRSKGIKVVVATDNMDTFHRWTAPALRLDSYFDALLSSFELRALKEDMDDQGRSLFFDHYLRANAIGPGESILLDDSATTGPVIRRAGIDCQCLKPGTLDSALQTLLDAYR